MFDPAQVHDLAKQAASLRDQLDALMPLAISNEAIAAIHRLPEAQRTCHQSLAHAFFHIARGSLSLSEATLAADRAAEGVQI